MKGFLSRYLIAVGLSLFFLSACMMTAPFIGSTKIDFSQALTWPLDPQRSPDAAILLMTRIPRILLAALTGMALSSAGVAFQALLRNPLATPYTLGISSGASLGAVFALVFKTSGSILGIPFIELFAFIGALGTMGLVYLLASWTRQAPTYTLLLAGVTVSFFFSALIMFLQYLSDFTQTYQILHWLMGGLDIADYSSLARIAPIVILSVVILMVISYEFNILSAGDDLARSRGVRVERTRFAAYFFASLATGAVVSVGGPVGFVGLIVPHTIRLMVGSDHRILLPTASFAGAGFVIICDTFARTLFAPAEIPIGVLTSLLGGPFFLILLFRLNIRQ